MPNHYVFIKPGEKVFVLTDSVAGDTDYTQIVQLDFPTVTDDRGNLYHDPKKVLDYSVLGVMEQNECANLTCEGGTVIDNYAEMHEAEINPGVKPFVSVPISLSKAVTVQERVKEAQETLKAFGAEIAE
jgi:hypothetical protein